MRTRQAQTQPWRAIALLALVTLAAAAMLRLAFVWTDRQASSSSSVVIGSKAFTESVLLAEIMAQWLQRHGVPVERRFYLGGTRICFEALRHGSIDLYPEYTGTALMAVLKRRPVGDSAATLQTVRDVFAARYGLIWLRPLGFRNTYALAMRRHQALQRRIHRISDLRRYDDLRAGFPNEFLARPDGWSGLAAHYALHLRQPPVALQAGLMFGAIGNHRVDLIAVDSTDGRVETSNLVLLEDDQSFFSPYDAVPLARPKATHQRAYRLIEQLGGRLDDTRMRRMNLAVDSGKHSVAATAAAFVATLPALIEPHREAQ